MEVYAQPCHTHCYITIQETYLFVHPFFFFFTKTFPREQSLLYKPAQSMNKSVKRTTETTNEQFFSQQRERTCWAKHRDRHGRNAKTGKALHGIWRRSKQIKQATAHVEPTISPASVKGKTSRMNLSDLSPSSGLDKLVSNVFSLLICSVVKDLVNAKGWPLKLSFVTGKALLD